MKYQITTPPTVSPVSLTEAKLHLRVDHATDDELINNLIRSATRWCELYENRAYCLQTITVKLDHFSDVMELPVCPLVKVDSITYVDTSGDTQTLDSSYYTVDTTSEPGRVTLAYNYSWPSTRTVEDAVTITYKAGYCTKAAATYASDILTVNEAVFSDTDPVRLTTDQGDLPAPLTEDKTYYVRDVTGSTLKLALTSGGTAITLTDDGTGTHLIGGRVVPARVRAAIKILLCGLYENRQEEITGTIVGRFMFSVKNLLMERRWTLAN